MLKKGMSFILMIITVYLLMAVIVQVFEYVNTYHPVSDLEPPPETLWLSYEDVYIPSDNHTKVNLWFFRNSASERAAIVFHGNGGNNSHRWPQIRALYDLGLSVAMLDYRGYGASTGFPSEKGLYRDGQAAYAWVAAQGYRPQNIVLIGTSLGGAVAAETARHNPARALILECTFTDKFDMARTILPHFPIRWFSYNQFDTYHKLPQISMPVLIVHGDRDDIIPYDLALKNFSHARDPKFFYTISGAKHNDYLETGAHEYLKILKTFIEDLTL